MTESNPPPDDPAQSQRFIDMAHEIGAENDDARFDTVFGKVSHLPIHKPSARTASKIPPKTRVSKK